jgi:hypothetical protein
MDIPRILLTGFTSGQFEEIERTLAASALSMIPPARISNDPRSGASVPLVAVLAANAEAAERFKHMSISRKRTEPSLAPPVVVLPTEGKRTRTTFRKNSVLRTAYSKATICDALSEEIVRQHIPQSRSAFLPLASDPLAPTAMQLWLTRLLLLFRMNPHRVRSTPSITLIENRNGDHDSHSLHAFACHLRRQVRSQDVVAWIPPSLIILLSFDCSVPADCERLIRRIRFISNHFKDSSWHEARCGSFLNERPDTLMTAAISLVHAETHHAD